MRTEIRNLRTMEGEETPAFTGTLYCDGKKAADLRSDGQGGDVLIRWFDRALEPAFMAHVTALPLDLGKHGGTVAMDPSTFLFLLVEKQQENKRIARHCRTKTLFRTKDMEAGKRTMSDVKKYVLWGRRATDEDWQESVLLSEATMERIEKMRPQIEEEGWRHLRWVELDDKPPDFASTVRRHRRK